MQAFLPASRGVFGDHELLTRQYVVLVVHFLLRVVQTCELLWPESHAERHQTLRRVEVLLALMVQCVVLQLVEVCELKVAAYSRAAFELFFDVARRGLPRRFGFTVVFGLRGVARASETLGFGVSAGFAVTVDRAAIDIAFGQIHHRSHLSKGGHFQLG